MNVDVLSRVIKLRHELHEQPELSSFENETSERILGWLADCTPTHVVKHLGGHGVLAVFDTGVVGSTILFRCELDALPIFEIGSPSWQSRIPGKAHLCGHDGHMAIMAGLCAQLSQTPPTRGKVAVLFQPAEETGVGAQGVLNDLKFQVIKPDYAFAFHNLPGLALHHIETGVGPFNFASEGISIRLVGKTAHASHPEDGLSPANAMSELVTKLPNLPEMENLRKTDALVTLVHARLGEAAFGVSPGEALVMATIRSIDDDTQKRLMKRAEQVGREVAKRHGLQIAVDFEDRFAACVNDTVATEYVEAAVNALHLKHERRDRPFRWSEDFGLFGGVCKSSLFVLGAGEAHPRLHNPDYDFPDELIPTGVSIFEKIAHDLCG